MAKYITVLLVVLILILGTVLFFRGRGQETQPSLPPQKTDVKILSTVPANTQKDVGVFSDISVSFSNPVARTEQRQIVLISVPELMGTFRWSSDGKVLTVTPSVNLKTNTNYKVALSYPGAQYSFSFTTSSQEIVSTQDQIAAQEKADRNFGEWQKGVDSSYPWLNKLPIQTADYFAYFDIDDKKFYADIYAANKAEALKQEITVQLKTVTGSDFDKFPIEYTIK